jgi:hypothetical protein
MDPELLEPRCGGAGSPSGAMHAAGQLRYSNRSTLVALNHGG